MQSTSATLRLPAQGFAVARATRVAIVAFITLVLVVVGCTAARASASSASPAATVGVTASQTPAVQAAALETPALQPAALDDVAATQRLLACIPGRDETRVETNALSPTSAVLHYCPSGTWLRTATHFGADINASNLAGRIPAALTHLDLGILRT